MNKTLALAFLLAGIAVAASAQVQPTPSMQEQYDKLHGRPPKTTTPQKSKSTSKPQSAQKPAKATPSKAPVAQKPKAPTNDDEGGFRFGVGVRGGANYCNFSMPVSQTGVTHNPILGYHAGLILSLGGKTFSVQPEILYSQIGYQIATTQGNNKLTGESILNTITVPVLLKLSMGSKAFQFFVNAGGYGSYALNGTAKTSFGSTSTSRSITFESGDPRMEYGAVGGAGVALGLGKAKLLIEGRYYYGLGNDNSTIPADRKELVRNIQGSVGILFPLGGK
ncbi:MAG: outer membrane beta-barrel protein [Runella sp.]